MSAPSMVHRTGNVLVVRSVVSGNTIFPASKEDGETEVGHDTDTEQPSPDAALNGDDCVEEDEEEEDYDEDRDLDLPECKIKRNYSCSACDFFTQNPRHFLYHLRDSHGERVRIYECPSCLYASKHFQKLLRHSRMVHGTTDGVELPDCAGRSKGKKRPRPDDEDDDVEDAGVGDESTPEGDRALRCSMCSFSTRAPSALAKHERDEHIRTKFFRCTKCTYVTHMRARFTKHVKYHSMPMIKCDQCDFRTPYKWNLDRHCKNHNGRGNFRCSACNFTADIKQSLTVHEMNHHVPPVGQAAGLGVGRRRNKVGASDTTDAEEAAAAAAVVPGNSQVTSSVSFALSLAERFRRIPCAGLSGSCAVRGGANKEM